MAKLTKSAFNERNQPDTLLEEVDEEMKKALIARVYAWQQAGGIYAWDEESLNEDLDMSIQGFVLAGKTEKGTTVEIEFFQPLDEDIEYEGIAYGYRLIMLQGGLYNLQKYRKSHKIIEPEEESE